MNTLRTFFLLPVVLAASVAPVRAATETSSLQVNLVIPDNNTNGLRSSIDFNSSMVSISDVNVWLTITNGWNGDLHAVLQHGSTSAVLLNRVGRRASDTSGYDEPGFNVKLDDQAANGDIHLYRLTLFGNNATALGGPLTGVWAPDGRSLDPVLAFDTSPRTSLLGAFNGSDPNGLWTLFVEDASAGDVSRLVSWGIEITGVVPEPSVVCLLLAGMPWLWWMMRHRSAKAS